MYSDKFFLKRSHNTKPSMYHLTNILQGKQTSKTKKYGTHFAASIVGNLFLCYSWWPLTFLSLGRWLYDMKIFWISLNLGMASDIKYTIDNHTKIDVLVHLRNSDNKCWSGIKYFIACSKYSTAEETWIWLKLVLCAGYIIWEHYHHKLW